MKPSVKFERYILPKKPSWFTFSRKRRIYVISRCCGAENGSEKCHDIQSTYTAIVLLYNLLFSGVRFAVTVVDCISLVHSSDIPTYGHITQRTSPALRSIRGASTSGHHSSVRLPPSLILTFVFV